MIKKYNVTLTLIRDQLGTNPCDPNVLDNHILNKQRKLILEKSDINSQINKYLNQIQISQERGELEVNAIIDKLEELIGTKFTDEERQKAIAGELETLKETITELDIRGTTVFFWNKELNRPMIGNHMIYGFLKAATEALCRTASKKERATVLSSASYTQSLINQHVKVDPQFLTFDQDILRNEDGTAKYLQRSLRAMTAKGPRITLTKSEIVPAGAKISFILKVLEGSPIKEEHLHAMFSYGEIKGLGQWRNADFGSFTYAMDVI